MSKWLMEASPLKRTWQGLGWLRYLSQRLGVHIPSCFQYCKKILWLWKLSLPFVFVCEIPVSEHEISFLWGKSVKCLSLSGEIKSWILLLSEFHLFFFKKWAIFFQPWNWRQRRATARKTLAMEGLRRHHRGYRGWNMLELSSGSVRDTPVGWWLVRGFY